MLFSSPIKMEWFYNLYEYKTKMNWILYEYALDFYDHIMDNPLLEEYRKEYSNEQIGHFCAYHARRLRVSALKAFKGQRKKVMFQHEYISDFYPQFTKDQVQTMNDIALQSWDEMPFCDTCPERCWEDYESRSYNFESHREFSS